jgi:hypothetical protein
MRTKLLFILGIVLTHGALGAVWIHDQAPQARPAVASCVNNPATLPYFEPPREILAMYLVPAHSEENPQP